MRDYLPAIFFIGMMSFGSSNSLWCAAIAVLCAVGFYRTAKKLGTEEE